MRTRTSRFGRIKGSLSRAAFVYLSATIVVMASERVYWYWEGFTFESAFFIGAFYAIPTWAGLWALAANNARRIHHVVLGAAVFAAVVEGVLTPIIYLDGPLPVMAFMFIGWHGLLSFVGFWYLARKWLIERARKALALASLAVGAGWGVWALASSANDGTAVELAADGIDAVVLTPGEFGVYAFGVGATLVAAHWLLGFVWPTEWRPTKPATWALLLVSIGYMAVAVLPAIFWAPLKLAVLVGGPLWLLARNRTAPESQSTIWERLAGRVRLRDATLMLLMPAGATATYAGTWSLEPGDAVLSGIYWALVVLQIAAGGVAIIWAIRRARRAPADHPALPNDARSAVQPA